MQDVVHNAHPEPFQLETSDHVSTQYVATGK